MAKEYQLDRKQFIEWYPAEVWKMLDPMGVRQDLIKGGEFILSAQDVLDSMQFVSGKLVGAPGDVLAKNCELVYNQE